MSPESWAARAATCRLMAPLLRDGRLEDRPDQDAFMARLSVTSDPPGAEVYLRALSRLDGRKLEQRHVGTTPLSGFSFDPGLFRVVVVLEGYETAELTRRMDDPGESHELHVRLRDSAKAIDDMARISGGTFVFGEGTEQNWPLHERELELDDFLVDRSEVSNGDYRAFVLATGAPAPAIWPDPYDSSWDDRPVVWVSRDEARAYAEWAGKRLPTAAEWQRMARGTQGSRYPDGAGKPDLARYAIARQDEYRREADEEELEARRRAYLSGVDPVDHPDAPESPIGIRHVLGNVSEWTESFFPWRDSTDRIRTRDGLVLVMGCCWWWNASGDLTYVSVAPPDTVDSSIGFRCVKSLHP